MNSLARQISTFFLIVAPAVAVADSWSCKYEYPPVLVRPSGSSACGESSQDGPHFCVARIKCTSGAKFRVETSSCDALPDASCPSADLCMKDIGLTSVAEAKVAKDVSVTEFWAKRDALAERRRQQQVTNQRGQTDHSSTSSTKVAGSR